MSFALLSEARGLVRLATGLKGFLASTMSPAQSRELVRQWMKERDARFLGILQRAVFGYERSPYLKLLRHAGCEYGDIAAMLPRQGLEGTLRALAQEGVRVTWEELKGRVPAVRGSRTFRFKASDFDSPLIDACYQTSSSGTSGTPVRVGVDIEEHFQAAPNWGVLFDAHGWMDRPLVFWTPGHTGLANRYLRCVKFGKPYSHWFVTTKMTSWQDRLRAGAVHGLARRFAHLPKPEFAPVDRPGKVYDCLQRMLVDGRRPIVNAAPSAAARLSLMALARGQSLSGVAFLLGAEPVTPARRRTIEESGAQAVPTYGTSECGWIGAQFPGAMEPDEVLVFRDAFAVIHGPGTPDDGAQPRPILLTHLRPACRKVLLNAEIGDSALIETRSAGDAARDLGYDESLHTIRSFRKITAWGVTLAQADLYTLLEETLPKQFGGSLADFQLVEQENELGESSLALRVSPRLGEIDEDQVRSVFLSELEKMERYYGYMAGIIRQAKVLRVERAEPSTTVGGKVLPVVTSLAR